MNWSRMPSAVAGEKRKLHCQPKSMWTAVPRADSSPHQGKPTILARVKPALKEGKGEAARKGRSLEADDMVRMTFIEVTMMQVVAAVGSLSFAPRP